MKKRIAIPTLVACLAGVFGATQLLDWGWLNAQDTTRDVNIQSSRAGVYATDNTDTATPRNAESLPQNYAPQRYSGVAVLNAPGIAASQFPQNPLAANAPYGVAQAWSNAKPPNPYQPAPMTREEVEDTQRLQDLLRNMRNGTSDAEAEKSNREQLLELLGKQLDRDLADREEPLEEIEQRAAELRTQLEARRKNKEQMLEILMMLAENPSAGLGIPPQWMQAFGMDTNRASGAYPAAGYDNMRGFSLRGESPVANPRLLPSFIEPSLPPTLGQPAAANNFSEPASLAEEAQSPRRSSDVPTSPPAASSPIPANEPADSTTGPSE